MAVVGGDPGDHREPDTAPPLTVELLADLQAGLLDGAIAGRVRRQVREDPVAARVLDSLNRVRRDIAALHQEAPPAPDVPATVVARIVTALRSAGPPRARHQTDTAAAHAAAPGANPARVIGAAAGLLAAVVAAGLGTAALIAAPTSTPSEPTTVRHVTVSPAPLVIPLSDPQILALLASQPDYGPLHDPQRRASCLAGLGYPANVRVLGARPVQIAGRQGVLLVLPDDTPGTLAALVVASTCNSADTGLLASRHLRGP